MSARRAVGVVAAGLVAGALGACGASGPSGAGGSGAVPKVTIAFSKAGCDPATLTIATGRTSFTVTNASPEVGEVELLDGNRVLSENENILPGGSKTFTAELAPKTYAIVCGAKSAPRGSLTVTPTAAAQESTTTVAAAAATTVDVTLREMSVVPSTPSAPAGTVAFRVTSAGTQVHEFVVVKTDLAPTELPRKPDGSFDESGAGVTRIGELEDLKPGTTATLTENLSPGRYVLVCNMPGHFAAGMATPFLVT